AEESEVYTSGTLGDRTAQGKRLEVAAWHYDRLIAARPDDWRLRHRRGQVNVRLGRDEQAEVDYDKAAPRADEGSFFTHWGEYHVRRGRYDRAAEDYRRAVRLGADNFDVWWEHAVLCLWAGDLKGYQEVCATLAARRNDNWYAGATNIVARLCVLG